MSKLILVRGIPGSGKSTYARSLGIPDHFEADMYFEKFHGGAFVPAEIKKAHEWCQSQATTAMAKGRDVVVSNTFVRKWEMEFYLNAAKTLGIEVEIVVCRGNFQNVHGVPPEKVAEMARRFEE